MIKNTLIAFVILFTVKSNAQYYKTYNWNDNPKLHKLTDTEKKESSIGVLEKYIVEFYQDSITQQLYSFETTHTINRVNNDKGINKHNTVYISMRDVKQVTDIKARTINLDGKITILNNDNIKEINNVEEYGDFKIFAMEGIEKGSQVEVLYTVEKEYEMHGTETLQNDYPIKKAQFLFITGDLNSRIKAYNTTTPFEKITANERAAQLLTLNDIPAMIEEEYSTPLANKIAVVYQTYPRGRNITQSMFWNNVVNNVGPQFFPKEPNTTIVQDLINVTKNNPELSNFQKANLLDDYIKSNFTIVKNNNADLSNLNYILANKSASDIGILKIYGHYLTALNIDYEVVITANRYRRKFDPDFFTPNMLQDFLIYLPTEEKYIAPDRIEYRVEEAPFAFLGNYGIYITKNLEYYFSKIIQSDPNFSRINRITDITFNDDLESVTINQSQEYTGHWSTTSRAILNLSPQQSIKEYEDYLTSSGIEDKVVNYYEALNTEMLQLEYNKPFITKSSITSEALLEEAGDSYIFQIGKVIGTQSELYQETNRLNPIEMQYPNQYDYNITIHIPKGYTVEGLEVLQINKSFTDATGKKTSKFESDYNLKGNTLVVTIQEFYKTNAYDINRYEEFRSVINAASDFNKTSILLKEVD